MTGTADLVPAPGPRRPPLLTTMTALVAGVLALVIGLGGYAVVSHGRKTYLAAASLLLDEPKSMAAATDGGIVDKLSRLRFKYAGIVRSDTVVDAVAKQVGLSSGAVAGSLFTRADTNSLLLFVGARAGDAKTAARLANALAEQLAAYVRTEQATIPPVLRLQMAVVAPARGAAQLTPTRRQGQVAGLGGFVVTLVLVLGVADVARRRAAAA